MIKQWLNDNTGIGLQKKVPNLSNWILKQKDNKEKFGR